jgi:hypothetical protein
MSSIVFNPAPPTVVFDYGDLFKSLTSEHGAVCFSPNLGEYVRVANDISDIPFFVRGHELYPRFPVTDEVCSGLQLNVRRNPSTYISPMS